MSIRYLTAKLAQQIDEELMSAAGAFSIDQVRHLATVYSKEKYPRVLVCCGPGNQGGDGLVAARHLGIAHEGCWLQATIWMPKPGSKDIYKRLHTQCDNMHIPTLPTSDPALAESTLSSALAASDVVLDAIFGFSFKPPVRAPFDAALPLIQRAGVPVVSVDIPSGWDVERGDAAGLGLRPDVLVSLTAPKEGVRAFAGRHFLGGRFVPKSLEEKLELNLPPYPGFAQIVELPQAEDKAQRL
ncbi:YjeF N-terminal domain-containing protein [Gloeopeniophorella convolvens]|nr:YjeF N-terminal domain-containing protein [Gloeopeniophorella convolvens]